MKIKIQTLTNKISEDCGLKSIILKEFITFKDKPVNIVISSKDDVNYMIFVFIDFSDLRKICNHIQIEIFTKLKLQMSEKGEFKLSSLNKAIDKNSTLIISTIVPNEMAQKELNELISSIEEEPYYYKKQVLTYKNSYKEVVDELISDKKGLMAACEGVISNIEYYDMFTSSSGHNKYQLVAMLYEKLPFFTLKIKSEGSLNLPRMINEELNAEQLKNLQLYKELTREALIKEWVDTVGVEDDKAG